MHVRRSLECASLLPRRGALPSASKLAHSNRQGARRPPLRGRAFVDRASFVPSSDIQGLCPRSTEDLQGLQKAAARTSRRTPRGLATLRCRLRPPTSAARVAIVVPRTSPKVFGWDRVGPPPPSPNFGGYGRSRPYVALTVRPTRAGHPLCSFPYRRVTLRQACGSRNALRFPACRLLD